MTDYIQKYVQIQKSYSGLYPDDVQIQKSWYVQLSSIRQPLVAIFASLYTGVPEHALHEKGLQRQIGVGTLVSSQERRTVVVPPRY